MDELDEARTELRRLFKQLEEIHVAIKTQKSKIDELVKKRPPAINRLPVELLSQIIVQSLPTHDDYLVSTRIQAIVNRRTNLSTVSRLWRNVILNTPKIWGDVVVWINYPPHIATLEAQLARSGDVPLNIILRGYPYYREPPSQWLDVLIAKADRWRRLYIQDVVPDNLNIYDYWECPSLEDVVICNPYRVTSCPEFLLPNGAPALQKLKLENFTLHSEFAVATAIKTLDLTFGRPCDRVNLTFIPTQSLTALSLAGDTTCWSLLRDSIHLPLLEVLKLAVDNSKKVMQAIVAPKLMCIDYFHDLHWHVLSFDTGEKFSHVQRLTLDVGCNMDDGYKLCKELCGVQHVNLHADTMDALFTLIDGLKSTPADHWTCLASISIYGLRLRPHNEEFDPLVQWLTKRLELGWPRLSVRLSGLSSEAVVGVYLHDLYSKLQTCSNPEVDDVKLSSSVHSISNGLFQVDLSGIESFVADDMISTFRASVP